MPTIALVRHATTAATGHRLGGWTPGVHLDDAGRDQARETARHLAVHPVAAVYTSPLERTLETATIIGEAVDRAPQVERGLGETDYGEWTNRPLEELRDEPLWAVIQATPSRATFPGGESLRASQARMVETLETIARAHDTDGLVVAVGHADPIKAALAHYLGMPLDTFQRIAISPASVSVLSLWQARPPAVMGMNLLQDLPIPVPTADAGPPSMTPSDPSA